MKLKLLITLFSAAFFSTSVLAFDVTLSNKAWDGKKVPAAEQCQKFGGISPATPELSFIGLPSGTDGIVMEYSDRDSKNMNNGGHGIVRYNLETYMMDVEVPAMLGHTFALPEPFEMIAEHRAPGWDKAGAYMPPCSGGKKHAYYVTIKAVKGSKVLEQTVLELGKY